MGISSIKSPEDIAPQYWPELADEFVLTLTNDGAFYRRIESTLESLVFTDYAPTVRQNYANFRAYIYQAMSNECPSFDTSAFGNNKDRSALVTLVSKLLYEYYMPDLFRSKKINYIPFAEFHKAMGSGGGSWRLKEDLPRIEGVYRKDKLEVEPKVSELTVDYVNSRAHNKGAVWTTEDRVKVAKMWEQGSSLFEICIALGRTVSSIGTLLDDSGKNPHKNNPVLRFAFEKWVNPNQKASVSLQDKFSHLKPGDFVILARKVEETSENRVIWSTTGEMDRLIGLRVEVVDYCGYKISFGGIGGIGRTWGALLECFELIPEHESIKREIDEHLSNAQEKFDKVAQAMQEINSHLTKEKQNMSIFEQIKSAKEGVQKLINSVTEDQVFEEILRLEAEIEKYKTAKTSVKAIAAKIKKLEGELAELVKFSDEHFKGATE